MRFISTGRAAYPLNFFHTAPSNIRCLLQQVLWWYYRKKFSTRARATIPSIISTSATLITVDMILTMLRLSSLLTQITENRRPASARAMLQTA